MQTIKNCDSTALDHIGPGGRRKEQQPIVQINHNNPFCTCLKVPWKWEIIPGVCCKEKLTADNSSFRDCLKKMWIWMGLVFKIYLRSRSLLPRKAWKLAKSEIMTWHNRNWGHSPEVSASPTGAGSLWPSHSMAASQRWGSRAETATQLTPQGTEQVIRLHKALSNSSEQSTLNNIFKLSDDCVESQQVYHPVPVLIISLWHKENMQNNALSFGKHSIFLQPYSHLSHWSSSSQNPETSCLNLG